MISYDHSGHGDSASAPMNTYHIDQLATDLLVALGATGPLTLGSSEPLPAVDRPVSLFLRAQQPSTECKTLGMFECMGLHQLKPSHAAPMLHSCSRFS
jgi:hypothetical protein